MTLTLLTVYFITSLLAGILAGLFGIGGGLIMVPALYFTFQELGAPNEFALISAVGTSLAVIIGNGGVASWRHHKKSAIDWQLIGVLFPSLAIGACLGSMLAVNFDSEIIRWLFIVYLGVVFIRFLLPESEYKAEWIKRPVLDSLVSVFIGGLSALIGIGGGTLNVPYYSYRGLKMSHAVATSSAAGVAIALVGTASYCFLDAKSDFVLAGTIGVVNIPAALTLIVGCAAFIPVGVKLAHKLPQPWLKTGFATMILLAMIAMIVK